MEFVILTEDTEILSQLCTDDAEIIGESLSDGIENASLYKALKRLALSELHILNAKIIEELTFSEIALNLGVGHKTVASSYYRSLEKLRQYMEDFS